MMRSGRSTISAAIAALRYCRNPPAPNGDSFAPITVGDMRLTESWCRFPKRTILLASKSLKMACCPSGARPGAERSEEHTSELQSLMRISYAVFCLKKKKIIERYREEAYKYKLP